MPFAIGQLLYSILGRDGVRISSDRYDDATPAWGLGAC
jgi:hypothetical protein